MKAKTLLTRLAILAAALIATGFVATRRDTHAADSSYLAAILEKDQLIRNTPSPRLVLVGGSNIAFGVDSKVLGDSLGLPVVDMGLYAKLGLKYMLAQAKPYIRKGDIVVVVPEYDQFYGDFANGDNTLNTALLYTPSDRIGDFIRSYSIIDVLVRPRVENAREALLRTAAAIVGKENQFFPPDTNPVYNRHSFNQYGDAVSHLGKQGLDPDSIFVKPLPPMKEFNRDILSELNSFEARAEEVGAHAYFMYPSFIDRAYTINVAAIDSLDRKLRSGTRMPFLGTPADFVFPKQYFFDTRYHLNGQGRELRTQELIHLLRPVVHS